MSELSVADTGGMTVNPHSDLIFRATGAASCLDCHRAGKEGRQTSQVLDNALIQDLRAKAKGIHGPGRSAPAATTWHREMVAERTACTGCHTEHRGALAQITDQSRVNPHGEFIFRATGAGSCTACHEFGARVATRPVLRDEPVVKRLYEKGRGAQRPGRLADCLGCHGGER